MGQPKKATPIEPRKATLDALRDAARTMASAEMETDPIPDAIAAHCARQTGKPLTKRDVDALEAAFPGLHVSIKRSYGCAIEWHATPQRYDRAKDRHYDDPGALALIAAGVPAGYQTGGSITIPTDTLQRTATGVRWPTVEDLKARNGRYFAARDERNAERRAALETLDSDTDRLLPALATLIDQVVLMSEEIGAYLESMPSEVGRVAHAMLKASRASLGGSDRYE